MALLGMDCERVLGSERSTFCLRGLCRPIIYNILPGYILPDPIEGRKFGAFGSLKESAMLEADYISRLQRPSLFEFCRSGRCCEPNTTRSAFCERASELVTTW